GDGHSSLAQRRERALQPGPLRRGCLSEPIDEIDARSGPMTGRYDRYQTLTITSPAPRVLQVTMDRPGRLNAADAAMHRELAEIWRDVDGDPEVSAVVVRGTGRGFSAGGDFELIEDMVNHRETLIRVWKEARDL